MGLPMYWSTAVAALLETPHRIAAKHTHTMSLRTAPRAPRGRDETIRRAGNPGSRWQTFPGALGWLVVDPGRTTCIRTHASHGIRVRTSGLRCGREPTTGVRWRRIRAEESDR